jgi:hypothetical protein
MNRPSKRGRNFQLGLGTFNGRNAGNSGTRRGAVDAYHTPEKTVISTASPCPWHEAWSGPVGGTGKQADSRMGCRPSFSLSFVPGPTEIWGDDARRVQSADGGSMFWCWLLITNVSQLLPQTGEVAQVCPRRERRSLCGGMCFPREPKSRIVFIKYVICYLKPWHSLPHRAFVGRKASSSDPSS